MRFGLLVGASQQHLRGALGRAGQHGIEGVEFQCGAGGLRPETFPPAARRALLDALAAHGLSLLGLNLRFDRADVARTLGERVARARAYIDLAADLGAPGVSGRVGVVPDNAACREYADLVAAARDLGDYALSRGVYWAVETGLEAPETLGCFLDLAANDGLRVALDPAGLCLRGYDYLMAVRILRSFAVTARVRDAVHDGGAGAALRPVGEGDIDWVAWLEALLESGFDGPLVIVPIDAGDAAREAAATIRSLREAEGYATA